MNGPILNNITQVKILMVSLIPLRGYLNKFQGFLDSLKNTPLEPTKIEKANTLLTGVDSVRHQVAVFNFGLQTTNPTYNDVKTQLMYHDQLNRSHSTSHPLMRTVTTSIDKLSVDTPVTLNTANVPSTKIYSSHRMSSIRQSCMFGLWKTPSCIFILSKNLKRCWKGLRHLVPSKR